MLRGLAKWVTRPPRFRDVPEQYVDPTGNTRQTDGVRTYTAISHVGMSIRINTNQPCLFNDA
jgi:hypothetical protein